MIEIAEEFNGNLRDLISKLNSGDIKRYREKFREVVK